MKHSFLRIAALFLALLLIFCLSACNTPETPDNGGAPSTGDPNNPGASGGSASIKNLIIIIGDGMGAEHIAAAELVYGRDYAFTQWQQVSVNTNSLASNKYATQITDSAAAATALATGTLTYNNYVGMDTAGKKVTNIMEIARDLGKATGVVTTDTLSGATPAGFSGHAKNRNDATQIITSQFGSDINLFCGQTDQNYASRKSAIEYHGYTYCDDFSKRDTVMNGDMAFCQFDIDLDSVNDVDLKDVATFAIDFLSRDEDGFVLMIEQAHIDKVSHSNQFAAMAYRANSLADTVDAVIAAVGDRNDTAVLVTADHETGGLSVSADESLYSDKYSTEAGGKISYHFSSTNHTDDNVLLFVHGITPDFKKFDYYGSSHLIKNTDIFYLMKSLVEAGKCP